MAFEIDPVLLSGDDEAIYELASDPDQSVVVDHRDEETDLVEFVATAIPEARLTCEWDAAGEDLILAAGGRTEPVGLTTSPSDRYRTIRAINRLLTGTYEIRRFRVTGEMDTHSFHVRPAAWWSEAEQAHPVEIARVFQPVDDTLDFP